MGFWITHVQGSSTQVWRWVFMRPIHPLFGSPNLKWKRVWNVWNSAWVVHFTNVDTPPTFHKSRLWNSGQLGFIVTHLYLLHIVGYNFYSYVGHITKCWYWYVEIGIVHPLFQIHFWELWRPWNNSELEKA